jgi:hypothetical protein
MQMIGYKGFDKDLKCQNFQYEIGKTYELEKNQKLIMCESGFHYCEDPINVFHHYPPGDGNRYCIITPSGNIANDKVNRKLITSRITIEEEISLTDMVRAALAGIKKWPNHQTHITQSFGEKQLAKGNNIRQLGTLSETTQVVKGVCNQQCSIAHSAIQAVLGNEASQIATNGSGQIAIGGHNTQCMMGVNTWQTNFGNNNEQCVIGNGFHQFSHGDYSFQIGGKSATENNPLLFTAKQVANGNFTTQIVAHVRCRQETNGEGCISINACENGMVKLGKGGVAVLKWTDKTKRARFTTFYEGEDGIEAGVWYRLDDDGQVQKIKEESNDA